MKHLKYKCLLLLMAVLCSIAARGATRWEYIDNLRYELDESTRLAVVRGVDMSIKDTTELTIPATVVFNGITYTVNSINHAFSSCKKLEKVTIAYGVNDIGEWAFEGCVSLTSIDIPSSVVSIGSWAFYGCTGLTNLNIPNTVKSIGSRAFQGCTNLKSIKLPNGLKTIESWTFGDCINLTSISIPGSVETVDYWAFDKCSGLETVDLQYGIKEVPSLRGLTSLKKITMSSSVTKISSSVFDGCTSLTSFEVPYHVTDIDVNAFFGCENLESLSVENGNSTYDSRNNCNAIIRTKTNTLICACNNTVIPSSIKAINSMAGARKLKSLTIPSGVTSIIDGAFNDCWSLSSIIVESGNSKYDSRNNCNAVIQTSSNKLIRGCANTIIPQGITSISQNAFCNVTGLKTIVIPESVTEIGYNSFFGCKDIEIVSILCPIKELASGIFYDCKELKDVTLPQTLTTIGGSLFEGCSSLRHIDIPQSVSTIAYSAFYGCTSLDSIFIPANVSEIQEQAFSQCTSLKSIIVDSNNTTYDSRNNCNAIIETASNKLLLACNQTVIPSSVTAFGNDVFSGCVELKSISIPNAITSIDYGLFRDCKNLVSVTLPESMTDIGYGAFDYCPRIAHVTCLALTPPSGYWSLEMMGSGSSLYKIQATLHVPNSVIEAYRNSYTWNKFKNIVPVDTIYEIGGLLYKPSYEDYSAVVLGYAGNNSNGVLKIPATVTIDEEQYSVTTIIANAFAKDSYIKKVHLPKTLKTIGASAFSSCASLTDVYCFAETVPSVEKTFISNAKTKTLHVPESALEAYKEASYWKSFGNIVAIDAYEMSVTNYVEYFIGTDPGLGYAKFVKVEPDENGAVEFNIPATELNFGLNTVGIRLVSYYDDGKPYYSPTTLHTVYRYHAEDAQTVGVEYFLNTDPGIGKAKCIIASSDSLSFDIPREQMKEGINVLGLRAISWNSETDYCYGATQYRYIYCPAANGNRDIERIEYFWDVDPGKGNGMAIDFYMVNDSAVVDCNIDYSGLSGTHILNIRALSHGVWSTLYQQAVVLVALTPLSGDLSLDPANVENVEQGRFSLLSSLLGALSTRGFTVGVNVNVADNTYNFIVSEESLLFIQKLYGLLVEKNFYLSMKAPKEAVFNFIMPEEFIYIHEKDIPQIVAAVQAMFSHILTENISILINGQVYQYDGFQVEPNDLMALKNMYNRLGGENWTVKKWSFKSNGRDKDELPGVTFSEEGRVREINLSNNGLVGELGSWELILPELRVLSLDRNRLTGDVAPFVSELTKLSSLDLCYNRLTEVSKPLPKNIGTLNLQSQFRIEDDVYGVYNLLEPFDSAVWEVKPIQAYISEKQTLSLPTILTYKHKEQNYSNSYGLYLYWHGIAETTSAWLQRYGESYEFKYTTNYDYAYPQDEQWLIAPSKGEAAHSAYPVKVHYMEGDANMSGYTDVLDVQHTLNYILSTVKKFNYSAANTYIDKQINVQDIVCTVNIVLDNELNTTASARSASAMPSEEPQGWLYTRNGQLQLMAAADVAAIDMELSGVKTSQVSLLLNHSQFQLIGRNTPTGSRYVIYSPTGQTIPAGEATALLKLSAQAEVVAAQAADIAAEEVRMALGEQPTGISQLMSSALKARFQGNSLVVTATTDVEHIALQLVTVGGATVYSTELPLLRRGETVFETAVAPGIYLLEMATKSGSRKMVKLMKK